MLLHGVPVTAADDDAYYFADIPKDDAELCNEIARLTLNREENEYGASERPTSSNPMVGLLMATPVDEETEVDEENSGVMEEYLPGDDEAAFSDTATNATFSREATVDSLEELNVEDEAPSETPTLSKKRNRHEFFSGRPVSSEEGNARKKFKVTVSGENGNRKRFACVLADSRTLNSRQENHTPHNQKGTPTSTLSI